MPKPCDAFGLSTHSIHSTCSGLSSPRVEQVKVVPITHIPSSRGGSLRQGAHLEVALVTPPVEHQDNPIARGKQKREKRNPSLLTGSTQRLFRVPITFIDCVAVLLRE